jgi:hypothetical protein
MLIFLIYLFFNFILQHGLVGNWAFYFFFLYLLSIGLSRSYDLGRWFGRLIGLTQFIFFGFFNWFFFQFYPSILDYLGIELHICFSIFFPWSYHDLMDLVFSFLISTFNSESIGKWSFNFFMKLFWSHDPDCEYNKLA